MQVCYCGNVLPPIALYDDALHGWGRSLTFPRSLVDEDSEGYLIPTSSCLLRYSSCARSSERDQYAPICLVEDRCY